jgi:hypothetical protein
MTLSSRPDADGLVPPSTPLPTSPLLHGALQNAETLAHQTAERARHQATRLLDAGSAHIRERPMQSMLIAAATGAALALLLELAVRAASSSR